MFLAVLLGLVECRLRDLVWFIGLHLFDFGLVGALGFMCLDCFWVLGLWVYFCEL